MHTGEIIRANHSIKIVISLDRWQSDVTRHVRDVKRHVFRLEIGMLVVLLTVTIKNTLVAFVELHRRTVRIQKQLHIRVLFVKCKACSWGVCNRNFIIDVTL